MDSSIDLSSYDDGSITSCARVREQIPTKVKLPIIFNLTSSHSSNLALDSRCSLVALVVLLGDYRSRVWIDLLLANLLVPYFSIGGCVWPSFFLL